MDDVCIYMIHMIVIYAYIYIMGTYGSFPIQIHDFGCYIDTPELNDAKMYRNP